MKLSMPSYRFQIMLLVTLVVFIAAFLMREVFIANVAAYQRQVNELASENRVRKLYHTYSVGIDSTNIEEFGDEIESILIDMHKISLAGEFYQRDIRMYTLGLVVFMVIASFIIFILAFGMITRPLARLLLATDALRDGDFSIQVPESKFSPLNGLIVAFNIMIKDIVEKGQQLIEAEKQVIWREMARAMAHEIKNPLTPIRLSAQRLEAKAATQADDLPEVMDKTIRVINEEVDNLQSLVNAFSGFAKMPEAKPEQYNLNSQLKEITDQYSDSANIELGLSDQLETIFADPMQIKQVLVNLVQNAIQASPDGTPILINTTVTGDRCSIKVIDHGQGISEENISKVFEPYFTTKKKGTGLGLAISRRIIRQHGGDIRVESNIDEGTIFEVSLPCNLEGSEIEKTSNQETEKTD